jgi:hypothetical protein
MQIAFPIPQANVNASFFDPQNFILPEVLVPWKFVSGSHVFGSEDKVLRTIVFRADLQHEVPMVRLSPGSPLTLVLFQKERLGRRLGRASGAGLRWPALNDTNRSKHHRHGGNRCLE